MLPRYFDCAFVHLRQKVRLRPELSPKFLSTLGLNPAKTRPEKPGPIYNSDLLTFENEQSLAVCDFLLFKFTVVTYIIAQLRFMMFNTYTQCRRYGVPP